MPQGRGAGKENLRAAAADNRLDSARAGPQIPPVSVHQLVYVSSAKVPFDTPALLDLLAVARRNNPRSGITGQLLYKDGNFMQLIEGEEVAVRALFARIERDPRHGGVIVLLDHVVPEREFSDWSMAFRALDADTAREVPGYVRFEHRPLTAAAFAAKPSEAQALLRLFRQQR